MNRKIIISTGIILLSSLIMIILWDHIVIISIVLLLVAYVKHRIYPIKKELVWFILVFLGSAIIEAALVNITHAWSYSNPFFLGVPLQASLFWGVTGTTLITLYDGLTNK